MKCRISSTLFICVDIYLKLYVYWKTWSLDQWKSVARWKSVAIAIELFVMNLFSKSCFHSTQSFKPVEKRFLFNSFEKVVLIQHFWKSRSHSTHLQKPSPFNSFEKVVLIQRLEWWFWNNQKEEEHFSEDVNSMY